MTVGIFLLYVCRARLNETYIANLANSARIYIFCPEFYFSLKMSTDFALVIFSDYFPYFGGKGRYAFCSNVHCLAYLPLQS